MRFLSPWAFLWLAAAVPVVLLYFLKLRRQRVPVSSTWLWVRSVQDLRVNAPFQKLRRSLLLILQLLLIALAVLALADPAGRASPPREKRWVLLVDRSASMQMRDVKPSRLAKAKDLARRIVRGCGPRDEVMVIAFSNRAQVMVPFTTSKDDAERAVDLIEPADTPTRIQEAFRIAASAVRAFKNREIVVLSDGGFEPIRGGAEDIDVTYVPVGAVPRNAAITALDVRKPARTDDPWTVFAQVDLFGGREEEISVECYVNGQLKAVRKVKAAPKAGAPVIFEVARPVPEVVEVRIAPGDDLEADDRAWLEVRQERSRILLAGAGNFFLEKALAHVRDAEAFRTDSLSKTSLAEYDVAVLDGIMPESLPEGRYLILGGVPPWEGIKAEGEMERPVVMDWDRRHPLARMINFSGLSIKSAPRLALPGYAAPVVETSDAPLVFAWEKGRTRAVVVAFKVLESDWPLRLSFPIFIANALDWLRQEDRARPRPGEPLRLRLAEGETEVEVVTPAGKRRKLDGEGGRDVVFGETDKAGLYTVARKGVARAVALNLMDPVESAGAVAKELSVGTEKVSGTSSLAPLTRRLWRWFAAVVLLLLAGEWYVYHRRIEL